MRVIGHLESEAAARTFSAHLYVKGIKNQIEAESDGTWAIWIHGEDELDQAVRLLRKFRENPNDPAIQRASEKAQELIAKEEQREAVARKRHFDRDRLFPTGGFAGIGPLTLALMGISVLVFLLQNSAATAWIENYLRISADPYDKSLFEVRNGQVWRLITPIFLHFGIIHILFNMLWMRDLGATIESRLGTLNLALMVVVIGVASNLGQNWMSGPRFGGMSGVVFGLLGYIWMRGKYDPASGLFLHQATVAMMLIWLLFGYTNILPMIANTAHTVGLVAGGLWGYVAAMRRN
jgi:GlpG protein